MRFNGKTIAKFISRRNTGQQITSMKSDSLLRSHITFCLKEAWEKTKVERPRKAEMERAEFLATGEVHKAIGLF